jgi:hypothetical protein
LALRRDSDLDLANLWHVNPGDAERSDAASIRPQSVVAALAACIFVVLLFIGNGPPERPKPVAARPSIKINNAHGSVRFGPGPNAATGRPALTSADGLRELSAFVRHPVYWLGERPGTKLELTRTTEGRIFLRYLSDSAQVGNLSDRYPFVATYRYPSAFNVLLTASRRKDSVVRKLAGGGLAVQNRRGPELVAVTARPLPSPPVFFSYPGSNYLIEVFDRSAERALGLVTSKQVRPVR